MRVFLTGPKQRLLGYCENHLAVTDDFENLSKADSHPGNTPNVWSIFL